MIILPTLSKTDSSWSMYYSIDAPNEPFSTDGVLRVRIIHPEGHPEFSFSFMTDGCEYHIYETNKEHEEQFNFAEQNDADLDEWFEVNPHPTEYPASFRKCMADARRRWDAIRLIVSPSPN